MSSNRMFARVVWAGAIAGSLLAIDLEHASAQDASALLGAGVVVPSAIGLGFAVADTVSFAMDSPWDDDWAAVDITIAGVLLAGWAGLSVTALHFGLQNDAYGMWQIFFGYSIAPGVIGGYLLAHALWSFFENDRPRAPSVAIAPYGDGVIATVIGEL